MSNIIGEEIEGYVAAQINARQILHGSGATEERNTNQINVLNTQTSWIKLASGVSVSADRLKEIGVDTSFNNMGLAKNNILFGGTSKVENNRTIQRDGLQPQNPNSSYTYGEFGYVPMAGILNTSIKTLNRGSLKKALVKFKVHDREQFEIMDLLYLRLGYTVLLEWGNSIYSPDGVSKEIVRNTIIDAEDGFFSSGFSNGRSYLDILPQIESYRGKWSGNYDGLLGKVSNFDWSFNEDGSYDITLTIISLGDVIESLKTNISVDQKSSEFLEEFSNTAPKTTDPPEEDPIEANRESNAISFMLWAWKWQNRDILNNSSKTISITTPLESHYVSQFLKSTDTLTIPTVTYTFLITKIVLIQPYAGSISIPFPAGVFTETREFQNTDTLPEEHEKYVNSLQKKYGDLAKIEWEAKKNPALKTTSPISNFSTKDAFVFLVKNEQYYLRFGALLNFLSENIVPIINSSPDQTSLFNINTDQYFNWMYSLPNQVSLDPRVCLVRNSNFIGSGGSEIKIYDQLLPFRAQDYATSPNLNKAYVMNIYLNFNFIIESLNANEDERGDINLYNFIVALCDGMNKALGGINNLEPIIDENTNTLKIIDTTPIPGITQDKPSAYTLQLYGYDGVRDGKPISNFIRKVDLKTAITPEYATMITVGATAGGYVKGTEATAFSRWNRGLTDRFKEEILPSNTNSQPPKDGSADEAEVNYVKKFLDKYTGKHGLKGNLLDNSYIGTCELSSDIIDSNISVVTEYYKFLQSQNKEGGGGSVGFIPFKLGLTMDGLSGIKIYNKLHVNTRFLPSNYGKTLDLIVTGVSHDLNNHDWETQIEATVIPKTSESKITQITSTNIQETITNVNVNASISTCSDLPPQKGLPKSAFKLIKSSSTSKDATSAIINYLEGGYYHPIHAYSTKTKKFISPGYDIMKNSGETIYGLDRVAGKWMLSEKGKAFWYKIDKISGYGKYQSQNGNTLTKNWDIEKYPKIAGALGHNDKPTNTSSFLQEAKDMMEERFNIDLNANFKNHPLKNIILKDGRLLFMWYRASWNGSGFFQTYASNLKKIYNNGETNIEKLICADLTYRYNKKSADFKPGVSKMAYMMDYNPS